MCVWDGGGGEIVFMPPHFFKFEGTNFCGFLALTLEFLCAEN